MSLLDPDGIIGCLRTMFPHPQGVIAGVDEDDCAVMSFGGESLVLTTDFINSKPISVEFGLGSYKDLGRLVVGHNLADLLGTGAVPRALLVGVMADRAATRSEFLQVMAGVQEACEAWSVDLVGGDTKLGPAWSIYGVAVGVIPKDHPAWLKSKAVPGQDIWISGEVGACCSAVVHLAGGKEPREWASRAILEPRLPVDIAERVRGLACCTAGTDISDGLSADLWDLCRASEVGAILDLSAIPTPALPCMMNQEIPPWAFGVVLGGDLQFVVTADPEWRSVLSAQGMTRIGEIVAEKEIFGMWRGQVRSLGNLGHRDRRSIGFRDEVELLVSLVRELFE